LQNSDIAWQADTAHTTDHSSYKHPVYILNRFACASSQASLVKKTSPATPNGSVFDGYIYLVPYVIDGEIIFLNTAVLSRKATRE
jgi:hypothetical protein